MLAMMIWRLLRVLNAESAALTLAVIKSQAERERQAQNKYEPTKLRGRRETALILTEEEHVYRDGRRLERDAGVDPRHAALGHAFVQDVVDRDVLPGCEKRRRLIQFVHGRWRCRQCHSLKYQSQRLSSKDRQLLKATWIRRRLGADAPIGEPLPPRRSS